MSVKTLLQFELSRCADLDTDVDYGFVLKTVASADDEGELEAALAEIEADPNPSLALAEGKMPTLFPWRWEETSVSIVSDTNYAAIEATVVGATALHAADVQELRQAVFSFLHEGNDSAFRRAAVGAWLPQTGKDKEVTEERIDEQTAGAWRHWPTIQAELMNHPGALPRDAWRNVLHLRAPKTNIDALGGKRLFAALGFKADGQAYPLGAAQYDAANDLVDWSYAGDRVRAVAAGARPGLPNSPLEALDPTEGPVGVECGNWLQPFRAGLGPACDWSDALANVSVDALSTDDRSRLFHALARALLPFLSFGRMNDPARVELIEGRDLHDDLASRVIVAIDADVAEEPLVRKRLAARAKHWAQETDAARLDRFMGTLPELSGFTFAPGSLHGFDDPARVQRAMQALRAAALDEGAHRARLGAFMLDSLQQEPTLRARVHAALSAGVLEDLGTMSRVRSDEASASYFGLARANAFATEATLKVEVQQSLEASLNLLFAGPVPAALKVPLDLERDERLKALAAHYPKAGSPPPPTITPAPPPLTIRLALPGVAPAAAAKVNDDIPEVELSGVAILLRQATKPWRALQAGKVIVNKKVVRLSNGSEYATIHPSPIAEMAGLSDGALSYDNAPLLGFDETPNAINDASAAGVAGDLRTRIVTAAARKPKDQDDIAAMPLLVFGREYEACVIPVPIGGVLPLSLRDVHDVTAIKTTLPATTQLPTPVRSATYWRTVGVQAMRTTPMLDKLGGARVLESDRPLARVGYAPEPPTDLATETPRSDATALAVLLPEAVDPALREIVCTISAPTIDWETYQRWIGAEQPSDNLRRHRIYIRAAQRLWERDNAVAPLEEGSPKDPIRRLEDPAVTAFVIQIVRGAGVEVAIQVVRLVRTIPDVGDSQGSEIAVRAHVTSTHTTPLTVKVKTGAATAYDADTHTLTVRPLDVAQVRVFAAVAEKEFEKGGRFHPSFKARGQLFKGQTFVGFAPVVFNVESASGDALPTPEALYRAITITRNANAGADSGDARLSFDPAHPLEYRLLGSLDVGWQYFRWLGRPLPRFPRARADLDEIPTEPNASAHEYATVWDAVGFAERSDGPVQRAVVRLSAKSFPGKKGEPATAFRLELKEHALEQYLRFSVTAHHRYAGMYARNGLPRLASTDARTGGGAWTETVKRFRKPAFHAGPINAPMVKVLLPLTRTDAGSATDVLIVLNESYERHGGFCEELDAAIELASVRRSGKVETRAETGRDVLAAWNGKDDPSLTLPRLTVRGPFGQAMDTDTVAPYFRGASFIVATDDAKPFDLSKLRFRWRLEPSAFGDLGKPATKVSFGAETSAENGQVIVASVPIAAKAATFDLVLGGARLHVSVVTGKLSVERDADARWRQYLASDDEFVSGDAIEIDLARAGPEIKSDADSADAIVGARWELAIVRRRSDGLRRRVMQGLFAFEAPTGTPVNGVPFELTATGASVHATAACRLSPYCAGRWSLSWLAGDYPFIAPAKATPLLRETRLRREGQSLVLVDQAAAPYGGAFARAPQPGQRFFHAALVTEAVEDAAGRPAEAYVGIADVDVDATKCATFTLRDAVNASKSLVVRVLTLEADPRFKAGRTPLWDWSELFPAEYGQIDAKPPRDETDVLLRIVAMSDPIDGGV